MPDNMNFPLPNKEELPKGELALISKMKYRIAIWTAAFSFLGLVITNSIPLIERVLTSKEKALQNKVQSEQQVKAILDSIKEREAMFAIHKSFNDINEIYLYIEEMRRELPHSTSITIYSTHDSGGVPQSGSPLHITTLFQANNLVPTSVKDYWQKRVIPEGYFHLARQMYLNGDVYISDLTNHKDIYSGETKESLDMYGTKALYGKRIKVTSSAIYYLVVSYDYENPILSDPSLSITVSKYSRVFKRLLSNNNKFL